jgi:glycopeptide antibiotics resistance protein
MNIYNGWISKTNWSAVLLIAVTLTQAAVPFMSQPVQDVVTAVLGALIVIFHIQGVNKAAKESAALGIPSSGQ